MKLVKNTKTLTEIFDIALAAANVDNEARRDQLTQEIADLVAFQDNADQQLKDGFASLVTPGLLVDGMNITEYLGIEDGKTFARRSMTVLEKVLKDVNRIMQGRGNRLSALKAVITLREKLDKYADRVRRSRLTPDNVMHVRRELTTLDELSASLIRCMGQVDMETKEMEPALEAYRQEAEDSYKDILSTSTAKVRTGAAA